MGGENESIMDMEFALVTTQELKFLYGLTPKMRALVTHLNETARPFLGNDAFLNAFGRELATGKVKIRLLHSHSAPNCEEIFGNWRGTNRKSPSAGLNEFFEEALKAWLEKAKIKE